MTQDWHALTQITPTFYQSEATPVSNLGTSALYGQAAEVSRRSTILPLYQYVKLRPKFQFNVNQSQIPQSITNHSFCGQSNANLIPILDRSDNLAKNCQSISNRPRLGQSRKQSKNQPICEQSLTNLLTKFQSSSINVNPHGLFRHTRRNCWDRQIIFTEDHFPYISQSNLKQSRVDPMSIPCQSENICAIL